MTIRVAELHGALHDLFHDSADQLAKSTGFCQRIRQLGGSVFAKSLVFCLLDKPHSSLQDFADFASENLDVHVSHNAFEQRFNDSAVNFLASLFCSAFDRCLSARPALLPILRRFNGVFLRDATLVHLPDGLADLFPGRLGKGGKPSAALKLVLEMELLSGQFTEAQILPGRDNEKTSEVAAKPLPEGSLLLEDMGFFAGERLQEYVDQGVYVLTRVPCWTAFFEKKSTAKGFVRLDVLKWLRQAKGWCVERQVYVLHKQKLALRLLAVRVPEEVAEKRREQVRLDAKKRGRPVSEGKLDMCEWNILVTNAPAGLISAYDGWELRRVRWQIELVFRVFKSEGGIEKTQARSRERVLSELYGKLLAMVVQRWVLLAAGYQQLLHSGQPAARRVKKRAGALLRALPSKGKFSEQIKVLAEQIGTCKIQKHHKQPSTLDRLAALDAEFRSLDLAV
jgi:Transposase DDE domain